MRKKIYLLLAITLLLVKSCYYTDGSSSIINVEHDSIPEVSFTTNFDDMDSIVFSDSILFTYNIDIDTADLYYVDLYFAEYWVYNSKLKEDSIYIGPYSLSSDAYTVTLVAAHKTHTGSIADVYNIENKTVIRDWKVIMNKLLRK